jgi:hypothetical protein
MARPLSQIEKKNMNTAIIVAAIALGTGAGEAINSYAEKNVKWFRQNRPETSFERALRGSVLGGVAAWATLRAARKDVFNPFGASQAIRDMRDESPMSHKAEMPHVSKPLKAPEDYVWSGEGDSKFLIIDPKYSL